MENNLDLSQVMTYDLIKELSKRNKTELEYSLCLLMVDKKIDFVNVSNAYTKALNSINDDNLNKLIETETSLAGMFSVYNKKNVPNRDKASIQRALYVLNQSKRFNVEDINKKYEYDEELAKTYSWYERNKKEPYGNKL